MLLCQSGSDEYLRLRDAQQVVAGLLELSRARRISIGHAMVLLAGSVTARVASIHQTVAYRLPGPLDGILEPMLLGDLAHQAGIGEALW